MKQLGTTLSGTLLIAFSLCSLQAQAGKPQFGDTFLFGIGGMEQRANASFSGTREGLPEVELDMDDLGMDPKASTIWVGFTWQFAEKWGMSVSYSGFNSKGDVMASRDGNFEGVEWSVGATLDSELDVDLYIIDLHWDFINTERSHFGAGAGLHVADLSATVGARIEADVDGNPIEPIILGEESTGLTAPLPNVFIRGGHRFGDSWYLGGTAGYFALEVNEIGGDLITARATAEWRPGASAFGLGLGYQYVSIKYDDKSGSRNRTIDGEFYGPVLFLNVGF